MDDRLKAAAAGADIQLRAGVPIFNDQHYPVPDRKRLADLDYDPLPSPRTRNSLARAVFAISLREGRDFATGQRACSGMEQRWQYHHLFPKDYLRRSGLKAKQVNHGLNLALVTEKTNSIIRNKPPHEYLTIDGALALAANGEAGRELPQLVASNQIPYDALVAAPRPDDPLEVEVARLYRAFIKTRAQMMERAMKSLTDGKATLLGD